MKKLMFLLSIVVLFSTTSCLIGDDGSGTTSAQITGKLIVFDESSVSYSDDKASITVSIPNYAEPKLDVVFNGVKFAEAMPVQVNIKFSDIPFTYTISEEEGKKKSNYIFDVTNLTPTISGAPRDEYTASRFWGCIGSDVDIRFIIPYKDKTVHFTAVSNEEK